MNSYRLHKIIGLVLILPMLGWTFTGLIFFIKPGYKGAYEQLALKTYPLEKNLYFTRIKYMGRGSFTAHNPRLSSVGEGRG